MERSSFSDRLRNLTHVNRLRVGRHSVFGEARYAPGGCCGPRIQRDFQLVAIQSGSMDQVEGAERFQVGVGEVALLLPGRPERLVFAAADPTRHTWVAVGPAYVPQDLALRLSQMPEVSPASASFIRLMEAALAKWIAPFLKLPLPLEEN